METGEPRATLEKLRAFHATGATRDLSFRSEQLTRLAEAVADNRKDIVKALKDDMGKPTYEAYVAEVAQILVNIEHTVKRLREWARPRRVRTPSYLFPSRCSVTSEPLGVALIIGPWNYPVELVLSPLVAAIAAGNCAVIKPSELAPASSAIASRIVSETFDSSFVKAFEGGPEVSQALLAERFDTILYTGGAKVGRLVMEAAAKNLTPVTLELGGKSPCIVDRDVDVDVCARRITWGKFFNAGQTCIAPDYLLVQSSVKERLLAAIGKSLDAFYGPDPSSSPDYARIVNERHFDRLSALIDGKILFGGQSDRSTRYIAPTVLDDVTMEHPAMQEEIFGPVLPVLTYETIEDALELVCSLPKPLAFYFFSRDAGLKKRVLAATSSGGAVINDTMVYYSSPRLPFGGVGMSGFGRYHGRSGFDTFSNPRSLMQRSFRLDIYLRYPPYKRATGLLQKAVRFLT